MSPPSSSGTIGQVRAAKERRVIVVLGLGLIAGILLGCAIGAVPLPLVGVLFDDIEFTDLQWMVLSELRLPRVLLAVSVGGALGVSGAVLQGLFRNPLAEPQLIGVSSGAALGAISFIVLGDSLTLPGPLALYGLPLAAITGAAMVTTGLYAFARRRGDAGVTRMLLIGIGVNALAGVGIGVFTWVANDGQLRSLTFWTLGSFGGAQWATTLPAILLIGLAIAVLIPASRQLDLLQLGETEAQRLGVSVQKLRRRIVFGSASAVGAAVAVSGIIGFVGLVVPHLARILGGVRHGYLLPASALAGALLVVLADLGARTVVAPAEMPVGLLTSALGAPFFLWLIARLRSS